MYSFLTGPFLWLSVLIFVLGLAWKVVRYIRGLDWKLERVAYGPGKSAGIPGAISSVLLWLIPFATHSWRKQVYFTFAFFFLHLGLVITPLFLSGHAVILQERFGISWPTLPMCVADVFTVLGIIGGVMMLLRRIALPEVRNLTNGCDWFVLGISLFTITAGFLARLGVPGSETWLLWHIFAAEVILILAPFTKLSHIVMYFLSRGQLGMDFAIKRGGSTRGPIFPW